MRRAAERTGVVRIRHENRTISWAKRQSSASVHGESRTLGRAQVNTDLAFRRASPAARSCGFDSASGIRDRVERVRGLPRHGRRRAPSTQSSQLRRLSQLRLWRKTLPAIPATHRDVALQAATGVVRSDDPDPVAAANRAHLGADTVAKPRRCSSSRARIGSPATTATSWSGGSGFSSASG